MRLGQLVDELEATSRKSVASESLLPNCASLLDYVPQNEEA